MVFDPIVDASIIGLIGVVVGIGGYALQNWQIKKAERERIEYTAKRDRYEKWINAFVRGFYDREGESKKITQDTHKELGHANNLLLLYGSDAVVKAIRKLWMTSKEDGTDKISLRMQEVIIAMRKDLVETELNVDDIKFLKL
jgi:hypothetical protein